jgi:hypothetical protein
MKPDKKPAQDATVATADAPPRFAVPADVLAAAAQCRRQHACVKGDGRCLCKVEYRISDKYLFVKPSLDAPRCPYLIDFGFTSHVCGCPVRNELHRKHDV